MFRMQLNLMFKKKPVRFAFLVGFLYAIYGLIYSKLVMPLGDVSGLWYYCGMGDHGLWFMYTTILSFLIAIPAMSFQWDVSDKTIASICVRGTWKEYIKAKIKVVFLVEYLMVVIPLLFSLLLSIAFFGHGINFLPTPYGHSFEMIGESIRDAEPWAAGVFVPFSEFLMKYPIVYILLYLNFLGLFVGVLGLALLAVSFWFRRFKVLLFLPVFLLMKICSTLDTWSYNNMSNDVLYTNFDFWAYVSPMSYPGKVYPAFFVAVALLLLFIYCSYRYVLGKELTDV